ncbi:EpsG family protein [Castellaniella sp.]|uniref:EpsG family protein n=1 Tax=Castellaniella sp. TaxID=1955812 RepID=UPI002AFF0513|nr:EpsG family protein [Castellaniella sp.]
MTVAAWIFLHMLLASCAWIQRRRLTASVLFVAGVACVLIVYRKSPTFDLNFYLDYFDSLDPKIVGHPVEPFFEWVSVGLSRLGLSAVQILHFWQVLILMLMVVSVRMIDSNFEYKFIIIFMAASLYYVLASQNGIRQGVSLCFLLLAFLAGLRGRWAWALLLCALCLATHRFSGLFLAISILFAVVDNRLSESIVRIRFSRKIFFYSALGFGVVLYFYVSKYGSVYGDTSIDWGSYRTDPMVKFIALSFLFVISERLMRPESLPAKARVLAGFRFYLYLILFPLSFSGEIFSRVAVFYFLIEGILMAALLLNDNIRNRLAGGLIMLVYGVAPNALNILSSAPRQWLSFLE